MVKINLSNWNEFIRDCRYYTVEFNEGNTHWQRVNDRVAPTGTSYTAKNLKPFTAYKFRIQATNDIGLSGFSPESNITYTLPAGQYFIIFHFNRRDKN